MAVRIGSARIDENGRASGGQAGDQTGLEVSTQDWYLHSKGWYVIRPKDPAAAEKIACNMQWACDSKYIGYDQSQNNTLYNAVKPLGYDISKLRTYCETDCARLVRVCVLYAGINVCDFYTGNMKDALIGTGKFTLYTSDDYCKSSAKLKRGDILVTRTKGHTVVVLSNGSGASSSSSTPSSSDVLRKGDSGEAVKTMQTMLIACGYSCGNAGVDGHFGDGTQKALKAFQKDMSIKIDGIYGIESKKNLEARYKTIMESQTLNNNVSTGQKWLNAYYSDIVKKCLNGELLDCDGKYGNKTRLVVVSIWKDVMNRKHGYSFTVGNPNFGSACRNAASKVLVKEGNSGTMVYLIQLILSSDVKGNYYKSKMDATFGSETKKAVIAYQKSKNLICDGIVGSNTLYSLMN